MSPGAAGSLYLEAAERGRCAVLVRAGGLSVARLQRLEEIVAGHVERGGVPGLAWAIARRGEVHGGAAGTFEPGGDGREVAPDTIFRISSTSKPITAVGALILVEECRLRLDDPVDDLLPELADRRVLVRPDGPLEENVPAERPITLRDLLTFRMGLGLDFAAFGAQPVLAAAADLELGAGPPAPAGTPAPDEWIRRLGTLPLMAQPGERWLYHISAQVLGVLVARAAGQPLDQFLAERLFGPLGMADTGFSVPPASIDRFGPLYASDPATGERFTYDGPEGQWATPPAFPNGADGMVSTVEDLLTFASMLAAGGVHEGERILSRPTVEAMATDQLTAAQRAAGPEPTGAQGWGLGLAVRAQRDGIAGSVGTYGWSGGLGTTWINDPAEELVAVLCANRAWTRPWPMPEVSQDFLTCAYAAIDD
jgi:CubicO group peptidase (beta-lactamase class C family)